MILERLDGSCEEWCTKVKPTRLETADAYALKVNGYEANPGAWASAPTFADIASELTRRLDDAILVGHNVGFDLDFLQEGLIRCGSKVKLPYHKVDTVTLAYVNLVPKGLKALNLDSIREFLGWSKDGAHTALVDARDCRRLYKHLTTTL